MRIFFNREPVPGPWGGGSKVLTSIIDQCLVRGHEITFDVNTKSNIIFCIDPRSHQNFKFETLLLMRNRDKSKLVQRIGDLGTHGKPELFKIVKETSRYSDHLIFPSNWAKEKLVTEHKNISVIYNAPLKEFKRNNSDLTKVSTNPYRIVTHHWSNNALKGFETYGILDKFCHESPDHNFTYIGRKPETSIFKNYIEPQNVEGLTREFFKQNLYLTASKQEAGANHVLEAIAAGLPVIYHKDGGSIVEYCQDYGIMYSNNEELFSILNDYSILDDLIKNMKKYSRDSTDMATQYVDLIEEIHENKH